MNKPGIGEYWHIKFSDGYYIILITNTNYPYTGLVLDSDDKININQYHRWSFDASDTFYHKLTKNEVDKYLAKAL